MKFLKTIVTITILIFVFDLLINLILPQNIKKKIGTSRNYSLKSTKFHHKTAPEINVNEFWGKKKYRVKTNEYSMRINEKEDLKLIKKINMLVLLEIHLFMVQGLIMRTISYPNCKMKTIII